MPKLKSAKKRLRQSQKRQVGNVKRKDAVRDIKRQVKKILSAGQVSPEQLNELTSKFYQAVDKAAKQGTFHANKASREKSRLMGLVKTASGGTSTKEAKPKAKASRKTGKAKPRKATRKTKSRRKAK